MRSKFTNNTTENNNATEKSNNSVFEAISRNPKVAPIIIDFQEGEKKHLIEHCITCKEVILSFHQTTPFNYMITPIIQNHSKLIQEK